MDGVICIRRNSLGCGDGQQLARTSGDGFVAALKSTTTSFSITTEACASGSHYDRTSCSPTWSDSGTYIYFYRLLCPVQPSQTRIPAVVITVPYRGGDAQI